MTSRDDMVIRPVIETPERRSVRQRTEDRRRFDRRGGRHRSRRRGRLLRAASARRAARKVTPPRTAGSKKLAKRLNASRLFMTTAGRVAARGAGLFAVVPVLMELTIYMGQLGRRAKGASKAFVEAQDAHTIFGSLDEHIAANIAARDFVEARPMLLKTIALEGKVNEGILSVAADTRRAALETAIGQDLMSRDPSLDMFDPTFVAALKARQWGLQKWSMVKPMLDEAIDAIKRARGEGIR